MAVALVAELFAIPFSSRRSLAIRSVVAEGELAAALALGNNTFQVSVIAGYLAGAASLAISPTLALRLNVFSFLVSAVVLWKMPRDKAGRSKRRARRERGKSILWSDRKLRSLTIISALSVCTAMGLEALIVPLVLEGGTKTRSWSGVVIALVPFATIVVSVVSTRSSDPKANVRLAASFAIPLVLVAVVLSLVGTTLARAFAIAIAAGGAFAATTALSTMVFSRLPFNSTAAVEFANYQASVSIGQAFGAVGVGVLAEVRSTWFAGSTAVTILAVLLVILRVHTIEDGKDGL